MALRLLNGVYILHSGYTTYLEFSGDRDTRQVLSAISIVTTGEMDAI